MHKYAFPAAIPGGGGSVPPATAAMMWASGVKGAYEQAESSHKSIVDNVNATDSLMARMTASVAAAEQARLAAESSAVSAFARDNGFAVSTTASSLFATKTPLGEAVLAGISLLAPKGEKSPETRTNKEESGSCEKQRNSDPVSRKDFI